MLVIINNLSFSNDQRAGPDGGPLPAGPGRKNTARFHLYSDVINNQRE